MSKQPRQVRYPQKLTVPLSDEDYAKVLEIADREDRDKGAVGRILIREGLEAREGREEGAGEV